MEVIETLKKNPTLSVLVASNVVFGGAAVYYWAQPRGGVRAALLDTVFSAAKVIPGVGSAIQGELDSQLKDLEKEIVGEIPEKERVRSLPASGWSTESVVAKLRDYAGKDTAHWSPGKVSGAVYYGEGELEKVIGAGMSLFAYSNPLHPDTFPNTRKMDAEVVAMTLKVFNGPEGSCGTTTSGGTESILMACLAYREMAKKTRGVIRPNMVIPASAHAAFDKACHYFGIEMRSIPVNPDTYRADVAAMSRAIDGNTIMLVGSAVSFPQGVMDPIRELSDLALANKLPLHVDSCLGSFCLGFAEKAGYKLPEADFRVPGVTSISCDTHKYGFGPKGVSTILYRSFDYRRYQYFVATEWMGGIYASPAIAGSRAGSVIAGTWAAMVALGEDGYTKTTKAILDAAQKIAQGVRETPGIMLYGEPALSVVCFGAATKDPVNALKVGEAMKKRGWNINAMQKPACVHIAVTYANAKRADDFVKDLKAAVQDVKKFPDQFGGGSAAIYGTKASAPPAAVKELVTGFIDTLFKI